MKGLSGISRRSLLGATATATVAGASLVNSARADPLSADWAYETDIVCVGGGASATAAAATAIGNGDQVILVEARPNLGGTTAKSGGVHWIPNNPLLRANGLVDAKADALAFMARLAYPEYYTPSHPTLGLPLRRHELLAAYYDNGSQMVERLTGAGAYNAILFDYSEAVGQNPKANRKSTFAPDYFEPPENKCPTGRALSAATAEGKDARGVGLVTALAAYLKLHSCPILLGHRVRELVLGEGGAVIGVVATLADGKRVRLRARKGVIFGSGGFAHNKSMLMRFQRSRVFGSCAGAGSQGDLVAMASTVGAALDNMPGAWRGQCYVEQALASNAPLPRVVFLPRGDSMIEVNKYGRRVVSEYRPYQTRPRVHETYDPDREEYPNELMFLIYDRRCVEMFGGTVTLPADEGRPSWIIVADSLDALADEIAARLERLRDHAVSVTLDTQFKANLRDTIKRFNGFARTGVDLDFGRGSRDYERHSFEALSRPSAEVEARYRPMPNPTMYPIASKGPYYAAIMGQAVLDTSGGPAVNAKAQILNYNDEPIPGLYGAGNCIGAPTAAAYYGTGGTIGPGMTFGFIAANHAHLQPVRSA